MQPIPRPRRFFSSPPRQRARLEKRKKSPGPSHTRRRLLAQSHAHVRSVGSSRGPEAFSVAAFDSSLPCAATCYCYAPLPSTFSLPCLLRGLLPVPRPLRASLLARASLRSGGALGRTTGVFPSGPACSTPRRFLLDKVHSCLVTSSCYKGTPTLPQVSLVHLV